MGTFFNKCTVFVKDAFLPSVFGFIRSNKIKTITVSALCVALASVLTGITVATNVVYINDGNQTKILYTMMDDAEEILESQDIALSADDEIRFDGFNSQNIGTIEIKRAFRVPVTADGETKSIAVTEATVADVLKIADVTLGEDDLINIGLNEKVHADTEIVINRVTYRTVPTTTAIPFTEEKQSTLMLGKGTSKISIPGQDGVRLTVTQQKLVDGKIVDSEILEETVQTNPITQLLLVGAAPKTPISVLTPPSDLKLDENGVPTSYVRKVTGKAVAYSALGKKTKLKPGNVAVDYRKFPKGTKLWITTPDNKFVYGYSVVADTGTFTLDPNTTVLVDLFFNTYQESVNWGAKQVNVYVLE